ncbi:MAG: alpha/beta hydrolase [Actinobacteria bacterium]|nr:alpha/beta hydrolase [Actinomycetota bacterium]
MGVVLGLLVAACGGGDGSSGSPSTPETTSISAEPPTPQVEGRFALSDGRMMALMCWGTGSPTIVLQPGNDDAGIERFRASELTDDLATTNRVCAYDRAGLGDSDEPPARPRTVGDIATDLDELLAAAQVEPPFVHVGSSFGGEIAMQHAALFPDEVVGVVLLDVPAEVDAAGDPLPGPDIGWDDPVNTEHLDFTVGLQRRPIEAPLVVVTASRGQSDQEEQSYWLALSPDASAEVLEGGHVIYRDNPEGVEEVVRSLLEKIRG